MLRSLINQQGNPDKTAVIENGKHITYRTLAERTYAIQAALPLRCGGIAAVILPDGGDYIAAVCAVIMSGMTAFPINMQLTRYEIIPLLEKVSACCVITSDSQLVNSGYNIINVSKLPDSWEGTPPESTAVGESEPMLLLATSGTTGYSKIVQLSERNVETSVDGYIDKMDFDRTADTRILFSAPLSSVYGIMIIFTCLKLSLTLVLTEGGFTLDVFYKAVQDYAVTHYEGGASLLTLLERTADRAVPYDIRTLKYLGFGGSKVSGRKIERILEAYPQLELYQGYGMTETAAQITKCRCSEPVRPDSVGTAINGVEVAVAVNGIITRTPNMTGEIVVKGANVMLGYYGNDGETETVIADGFLHTGDVGYLDADGYLYIVGRKKNIIIVRGYNVHPEEIEERIINSGLARECRVYGKTGEDGGETVCADIVPAHPEINEVIIRTFCQTHFAGFKQPRIINICSSHDEFEKIGGKGSSVKKWS